MCFELFTFYDCRSLHWQSACVSSCVGTEKVLCTQYVPIDKPHINTTIHTQNTHNTGPEMHNYTSGGEINTIQTAWKTLTCCICLGGPWAQAESREPAASRLGLCSRPPLVRYSVTDLSASQYCVYIPPDIFCWHWGR